jgi:RimJ/RimL family protein N-acetyltransferase
VTEYSAPPIAAPLPDVATDRLVLRRFDAADVDALAAVFAKPEVWRFPYGRAFSREDTESFLAQQMAHWEACGFGLWLAVHRESQRAIGYVGLSVPMFLPEILPAVEVGWRLDPDAWGQGLATEAATAALREGFETLQLEEITSIPQVGNPQSSRVCERLGMRLDRTLPLPATDRRGPVEAMLYVLSRDEWAGRARA